MIRPLLFSLSLVLILCTISFGVFGQADCADISRKNRETLARNMVSELGPDSVLAIRLQGYERQILELDKLIDAASNPKSRQRLIKRRDEYKSSSSRWLGHLQVAFSKYYNQSKVAFYLDHDQALVHDQNASIWLQDNGLTGKMDNHSKPKFFLVQGTTSKRGLEAFIMKDEAFQDVCAPLPAYFKMNSLSTFFLSGEKEASCMAEKLARSVQAKIAELKSL